MVRLIKCVLFGIARIFSQGKEYEFSKIRLLSNRQRTTGIYLSESSTLELLNDKVVLHPDEYKLIFGKTLTIHNKLCSKRGYIQIRSNSKKKIYREFYSGHSFKLPKDTVGLTILSLQQLGFKRDAGEKVTLKGFTNLNLLIAFRYYWFHTISHIRVAFKLGVLSVCLGLISIILTMFPSMGHDLIQWIF